MERLSRFALCGLLVLILWSLAPAAVAQPMPGAPVPYAAWDGESPLGAPPPVPEETPQPLERSSEFARRSVELDPELGFAMPRCSGRTHAGAPCSALGLGGFAAFSALYRPNPYFAFGGGVLASEFASQGPSAIGDASGRLIELAAVARVYMLESGRVEPYLELWMGGGTQKTAAVPLGAPRFEQVSTGVGGRVGGGVDFYLGEHVRLGPSISAVSFFTGESRRCAAGSPCGVYSLERHAQLMGAYTLSLRLSLGFGSRL
jgi:hypothetical protein